MTYFEGFVVPVPEANRDAYLKHSRDFAPILQGVGVRRMVECWESDVADGKLTDFRKAVDAKPGEKIVFSWFEYPSRTERDSANQKMMSDAAMAEMGKDMPFDGKRMIMGGFDAIVEEGSGGGPSAVGMGVPFPNARREAYVRVAGHNAKVFIEYGAARIIEALGDDLSHGQVTDFYRAVQAKDDETVAFSFIEWPDKATRDRSWEQIMKDNRMQHGGGLFDGKRMFWGGFDTIVDTASQEPANSQSSAAQPA